MAPAARPVNANISSWPVKWSEAIGRGNAAAFDKFGWLYFVRDNFDLYYPGYYDSWPALNGAMGTTYETDGGPALLKRRADGTLLSLRDGISKHYEAAIATFETSARGAREMVRDYAGLPRRRPSPTVATGTMKRVVFLPGSDPGARRRAGGGAAPRRRRGDAHHRRACSSAQRARLRDGRHRHASTFPAGSYVVDIAQPQGKVAKAVLEADPELDPVFAKAQVDKFKRNKARSRSANDARATSSTTSRRGRSPWRSAWRRTGPKTRPPCRARPLSLANGGAMNGEVLPHAIAGGIVGGARRALVVVPLEERPRRRRQAGRAAPAGGLPRRDRQRSPSRPARRTGRAAPGSPASRATTRRSPRASTRSPRRPGVEVRGVNTAFPDAAQYGTGSGVVRRPAGAADRARRRDGHLADQLRRRLVEPRAALRHPLHADLVRRTQRRPLGVQRDHHPERERRRASARARRSSAGWRAAASLDHLRRRHRLGHARGRGDDLGAAHPAARRRRTYKPGAGHRRRRSTALARRREPQQPAPTTSPTCPAAHFDVVFDLRHWLTLGLDAAALPRARERQQLLHALQGRRQRGRLPHHGHAAARRVHLPRQQRAPAQGQHLHHAGARGARQRS